MDIAHAHQGGIVQLKGTVYVPHVQPEESRNEEIPSPGVHLTHKGVLSFLPISENDSVPLFPLHQKLSEILYVKLPVRIHEEQERLARGVKAGNQCAPVTTVGPVMYHAYARISSGKVVGNDTSAVAGAVIHN